MAGVRFQMMKRERDGRAWRWAERRWGARAPAPARRRTEGRGGERRREARAEREEVRRRVRRVPSREARGWPEEEEKRE